MMSFLLHTEPAGKMKRYFDEAGQNEVVLVRPGVVRHRRNKEIPVPHAHVLHGEGKSKTMHWDESGILSNNQHIIS